MELGLHHYIKAGIQAYTLHKAQSKNRSNPWFTNHPSDLLMERNKAFCPLLDTVGITPIGQLSDSLETNAQL